MIAINDELSIPLQTAGTKKFLNTRVSNIAELEQFVKIEMTSKE